MRSKIILSGIMLGLLAVSPVQAACTGFGNMRTCTDESGNTYTVNRFGNTTTVQGSNPYTDSQWNQTTSTFGNRTTTNGMSNGRPWNETQTQWGNNQTVTGTDSYGRPYSYTCSPNYGCTGH
jgi:hypothetical protein